MHSEAPSQSQGRIWLVERVGPQLSLGPPGQNSGISNNSDVIISRRPSVISQSHSRVKLHTMAGICRPSSGWLLNEQSSKGRGALLSKDPLRLEGGEQSRRVIRGHLVALSDAMKWWPIKRPAQSRGSP